eukprot:gnl/Dysnectes_brevis/905_a1006_1736.p1 GENE.gnl/Dysnectes_brevis/905_a1006_1736~~gnl/Dysnectes_brevis/905_a1006_1736.p1  ORF type:complete len:797 (-),score=208.91 gnl/Dysnectes_brevis/905_a1006_1736:59-2449(-)
MASESTSLDSIGDIEPDSFICPFNGKESKTDFIIGEHENTFPRMFVDRCAKKPTVRCLGTRSTLPSGAVGPYVWYSYTDIQTMASQFASGLLSMGFSAGDTLAIMAPNRVEWSVVDLACGSIGVVTVPLYDTQTVEDMVYVCRDAHITAMVVSLCRMSKWTAVAPELENLQHTIIMDDKEVERAWASAHLGEVVPEGVPAVCRDNDYYDAVDAGLGIAWPKTPKAKKPKKGEKPAPIPQAPTPEAGEDGLYPYAPPAWAAEAGPTFDAGYAAIVTSTFHSVMAAGRAHQQAAAAATGAPLNVLQTHLGPDTVLSYVYTSGTTGNPKGVVLTHLNVLWTSSSMQDARVLTPPKGRQNYVLSYLPNAHIFMRVIQGVVWRVGGVTAFWQGSVKSILSDIQAVRPTLFIGVPRIYSKFFDSIVLNLEKAGRVSRFAFLTAYGARRRALKAGKKFPRWTNAIFKRTEALLGGRCPEAVSGSAPLLPKTAEFLRIVCNMGVFEGWGMTETSAHGTVQPVFTSNWGGVGITLDKQTQIKICSVPEMDYLVTDMPFPRGEVCIRGPSVFQGYHNDPERTAQAFDEEGYFRTGDIGQFRHDTGELQLIDRLKNIFKLAQGEFVVVSLVESNMLSSPYLQSVLMYGSRFESFVLGSGVPEPTRLIPALREAGILEGDANPSMVELCEDPRVMEFVTADVVSRCREGGLRGFEIPRALVLDPEPWTVENGLLTPAMKKRRPKLVERFEPIFTDFYRRVEAAGGPRGLDVPAAVRLLVQAKEEGPMEESQSAFSAISGFTGISTGSM